MQGEMRLQIAEGLRVIDRVNEQAARRDCVVCLRSSDGLLEQRLDWVQQLLLARVDHLLRQLNSPIE